MSLVEQAVIIETKKVPGIWNWSRGPGIARQALPGQFINIRVGSTWTPARRPFSVYDNDKMRVISPYSTGGPGYGHDG